jgi:hypothetical protein
MIPYGGNSMTVRITAIVAAFVFLISPTQPSAAQDSYHRERLIKVQGTAEINVPPDEVILNLGVDSHDKVLAIAKGQNDKGVKRILLLARGAGIQDKDIKTSALEMGPEYSSEKIPRLLDYEVSQAIGVTLRDLSKYETLMTKFLEAGVNRVDSVEFRVAETRKYRDEARAKAIAAAKEKAVAMAAQLGQGVGKPWEITEEHYFTGGARPNASLNYSYAGAAADEEPTVAPGQVTIGATVGVSFLLE